MLPFYFLSVVLNAVAGLIFVFLDPKAVFVQNDEPKIAMPFIRESKFLLAMTIASGVVAIIKILMPMRNYSGARLFFIGDFFPVIAGLIACLMFASRYAFITDGNKELPSALQTLTKYERYIGFFCFGVAIAHFLLASWILF